MENVKGNGRMKKGDRERESLLPGIVIHGRDSVSPVVPRIQAFIYGGKMRTAPILPYGRWKGAA